MRILRLADCYTIQVKSEVIIANLHICFKYLFNQLDIFPLIIQHLLNDNSVKKSISDSSSFSHKNRKSSSQVMRKSTNKKLMEGGQNENDEDANPTG